MQDPKTCKYCKLPLVVKKAKLTPEKFKKQYYYTAYFFCTRCSRIYFDNKFKLSNGNHDLFTDIKDKNILLKKEKMLL